MRTFVTAVNVLHDNAEGPGAAVIEIDDALLETIKRQRAALLALLEAAPSTFSISTWDSSATFVDFLDAKLAARKKPFRWKKPNADLYREDRTDCVLRVVTKEGVSWEANLKYSCVPVETVELTWKELGLGE